jgi:ferritin-like metal-binding protein YciE
MGMRARISHAKEVFMKTLQDAFEHGLKDIYYAENALLKAMPQLAQKAQSEELRAAIEQHEEETRQQVKMLEQVFQTMGLEAQGERCEAVEGLIAENQKVLQEAQPPALDALIVAGAQANEHYEITKYGTMIAWARELGRDDVVGILEQILEQEKTTDQKLTRIAESQVNERAQAAA